MVDIDNISLNGDESAWWPQSSLLSPWCDAARAVLGLLSSVSVDVVRPRWELVTATPPHQHYHSIHGKETHITQSHCTVKLNHHITDSGGMTSYNVIVFKHHKVSFMFWYSCSCCAQIWIVNHREMNLTLLADNSDMIVQCNARRAPESSNYQLLICDVCALIANSFPSNKQNKQKNFLNLELGRNVAPTQVWPLTAPMSLLRVNIIPSSDIFFTNPSRTAAL